MATEEKVSLKEAADASRTLAKYVGGVLIVAKALEECGDLETRVAEMQKTFSEKQKEREEQERLLSKLRSDVSSVQSELINKKAEVANAVAEADKVKKEADQYVEKARHQHDVFMAELNKLRQKIA